MVETHSNPTALYALVSETISKDIHFRAIPYFAWDNREGGAMRVWLPEAASKAGKV